MNKRKVITVFITSSMVTFAIAATALSPNQNNQSGLIPSGYDDLIFSVSNGNWVKNISLPNVAKEGSLITIKSTAGYDSDIDLTNINIEKKGVLTLKSGNSYRFKFTGGKWEFYATETASFNPEKNGSTIPVFQDSLAQYAVTDSAWVDTINLPQTGQNGQILVVKSNALTASKINSQNALFASSLVLNKNDAYIFQYNQELTKWIPLSVPTRIVNVVNGNTAALNTALQHLTAPKTEIRFGDGAWVSSLKLPQTANDRDRIIVTSTASWQSVIENENTNTTATLKLNKGNRYEFIYIADKSYWVLTSSPKTVLSAKAAAQGFLFKTPVVEINADNEQWVPVINLPVSAQAGDKVIIANAADTALTVSGANITALSLKKGDKIRYVFKNGVWNTDSYQIDLLLVNSPVVNEKLGATAAKIQAREALRLTNEALENSQAKAYYKEVGYLDYRIPGTTLGDAINLGRSDATVQAERTRTGADAIYTITDHSGCGLAYINSTPSKYNMIGSHNYGCGITAMRHELGHNMGLGHSFDRTTGYNWGFGHPLGSTIMGGNQIGLYSSPDIYSPEYGVRLGEADKFDGLRKINENAEAISKFFAAVN